MSETVDVGAIKLFGMAMDKTRSKINQLKPIKIYKSTKYQQSIRELILEIFRVYFERHFERVFSASRRIVKGSVKRILILK